MNSVMIPDQQEIADDLVDTFEMFDSWEDRYGVLIDFGKKLPPLEEGDKTEENRVHGCQSQVWMVAKPREENGQPVIDFIADSDALIVKGLIAILRKVYSGQSPQNILSFDIAGLLQRLGLDQHLTTGRRNGLDGMVQRIKALAAQQVSQQV
ncbi:MAG TPA: SufE family protein [Abditibacteriaceae bacterium]